MTSRVLILSAILVAAMATAVFAQQKSPDFSGKWKLDVSASQMGERSRIESMEMTVTQTASELTIERTPKFAEGDGGGRGMGRGAMGGGALTYDLSGKETKGAGPMGSESKLKAESGKDGILKLIQQRSLETQMGSMSITTVEKWVISGDGKTLTVSSSTETPRGTREQKMVFQKQ